MKRYLNTAIGVFDSGVGGLSVLSVLERHLPNEHYIYFGDTKNLPYGNKTADEIINFGRSTLKFLRSQGAHHVVMACNTSSALAYDVLKSEFPDIKIYPIIQDVACALGKYSRIGVMATVGTVNSHKYSEEILKNNPCAKVYEEACERFVEIVENRLYDAPESIKYIEQKLKVLLAEDVEKIVLGCTHYPYLMPILTKFAPEEMFIDPSIIFAKNIAEDIRGVSRCCSGGFAGTEHYDGDVGLMARESVSAGTGAVKPQEQESASAPCFEGGKKDARPLASDASYTGQYASNVVKSARSDRFSSSLAFFVSGDAQSFIDNAKTFYNVKSPVKEI